jgi:hypothetical protein
MDALTEQKFDGLLRSAAAGCAQRNFKLLFAALSLWPSNVRSGEAGPAI